MAVGGAVFGLQKKRPSAALPKGKGVLGQKLGAFAYLKKRRFAFG